MRLGVEGGGTFTALVVLDRGRVRIAKLPSTPETRRRPYGGGPLMEQFISGGQPSFVS